MDPLRDAQMDVIEEVARLDTSAGWTPMIGHREEPLVAHRVDALEREGTLVLGRFGVGAGTWPG